MTTSTVETGYTSLIKSKYRLIELLKNSFKSKRTCEKNQSQRILCITNNFHARFSFVNKRFPLIAVKGVLSEKLFQPGTLITYKRVTYHKSSKADFKRVYNQLLSNTNLVRSLMKSLMKYLF